MPEPVFNYWDLRSSCGLPDTEEVKGVAILRWREAGVRRCTLHQRAREKNDERAYARLNLFNVETCEVVVECFEIVKVI